MGEKWKNGNKDSIQDEIKKIVKKLLPEDKMKELKIKRQKEIKNNEKLKEEYKFIEDEEKIQELVESNYTENFLLDIGENKKIVLVMGINPGGGKKIKDDEFPTKHQLAFVTEEYKKELEIFNNCEIFQGYYGKNYGIFEKIDAKAHWSMEGYLPDDEKQILINRAKEYRNSKKWYDTKNKDIIDKIKEMQEKESKRTGPYVIFGELLWYADGTQANIEKVLNYYKEKDEKDFYEKIIKILELNIEYYNPKMVVITNAYASHLIDDALKQNNENVKRNENKKDVILFKNTPIIFSGMVSGQRAMDDFSYERLKERIEECYKKSKWRKDYK